MGVVAAILAGGRASRMGGVQKALLEVDGRAIVDRQVEALGDAFDAIAVVLPADGATGDDGPFAARGLEVVRDAVAGRGPLQGLATALAWAGARPLLLLACDMPYVSRAVVALVVERARVSGADVTLPVVGGRREPLLGCYATRVLAIAQRAIDDGRLRLGDLPDAARAAGCTVEEIDERRLRTVDPDLRAFVNINRPIDRV